MGSSCQGSTPDIRWLNLSTMQDEARHQANKASGWFGARRDEAEDQADRAGNYASRKSRDARDSAEDQGRCAAAPTASSRNQQGKRWAGTQAEHSVRTGSQWCSQLEAAVCTAQLCQPTAALSASSSAAVQVAIRDLHCHLHCDLHLRTLSVFRWCAAGWHCVQSGTSMHKQPGLQRDLHA